MAMKAEQVGAQMIIEAVEACADRVLESDWSRDNENDRAMVAALIGCEVAEWLSRAGWIVVGSFTKVERAAPAEDRQQHLQLEGEAA